MFVQVKTWGNSQGIRLSKDILESAGIKINDILNVELIDGNILLKKKHKHRTLEERTAEFQGKVDPYEEFDWGEPVGRERW
jgi:antitoxin MazE